MTDLSGWKGQRTTPPGPSGRLVGELRALKARAAALETRAPLRAASISSGGLVIKDGGRIRILDGGGLSAYRPDTTHAVTLGPIYDQSAGGALTWYGLLVEDTTGEDVLAVLTRIDNGISSIQAAPTGSVLIGAGGQVDLRSTQQLYQHVTGPGQHVFLYSENGGGAFVRATSGTGAVALTSAGGEATVEGGTITRVNAGTNLFLDAANAVVVDADDSVFIEAGSAGGTGSVQLKVAGTSASANRRVEFVDDRTAAPFAGLIADLDSAGMHLYRVGSVPGNTMTVRAGDGSDYRVGFSGSSRRWKTDIEDHVVDLDVLLSLRPLSWRDKAEAADHPETTNRYAGFVAEEVHEAGFTEGVIYEPGGQTSGLNDHAFIAGLLQLAQHQQTEIAELRARLDALDDGGQAPVAARTMAAPLAATDTHTGDVIAIPPPVQATAPAPQPPRPEPTPIPQPTPHPDPQEA